MAGLATGPGHMAPGRLGWPQGGLYGYIAWPHDNRVAGMATGPGHMTPVRLGWQQDMAPGKLGLKEGLTTWHQGGWDGCRAWPHCTREAGIAIGSGHMAPGWLEWQQGKATWHQGG